MESPNRVAIFIDGSNLYHSLDENCGRMDLDFEAFGYKLAGGRPIFRVYYYNVLQDERKQQGAQEQARFLATLYNVPRLEVRLGTTKYRGEQIVEKGVDIMLATDLLQFAWEDLYDTGILVSGDGDFAYAVQTVKNLGKYVEVAAFAPNLSWDLAHIADDRIMLEKDWFRDLWVSGSGKRSSPAPLRIPPPAAVAPSVPPAGIPAIVTPPARRRRHRGGSRRPQGSPPPAALHDGPIPPRERPQPPSDGGDGGGDSGPSDPNF